MDELHWLFAVIAAVFAALSIVACCICDALQKERDSWKAAYEDALQREGDELIRSTALLVEVDNLREWKAKVLSSLSDEAAKP